MGIEDIQISEELQTNAPSIRYSGNEGPKSPQEEQQMMIQQGQEMEQIANQEAGDSEMMTAELDLLRDEYLKYVFEMEEQGLQPMSFRQFLEQAMAEGKMSGGQPLPQDPTKPVNPWAPKPTGPTLPNRQMAAYGGIMGLDGRRRYGIGSSLKKRIRKLIPNEIAGIAETAAPFVAPFNPLAAGLMSGIGGFDRHGSIGKGLKSGLMNYGMGNVARWAGGAGPQWGLSNPNAVSSGFMDTYLSSPIGTNTGIGKWLDSRKAAPVIDGSTSTSLTSLDAAPGERALTLKEMTDFNKIPVENLGETGGILKTIKDFALDNKLLTGLAVGTLGAAALTDNMEPDEIQDMQRGEGLDIEGIRAEVIEAYKDPSGEKLKALASKYPFLSKRENIDLTKLANGGRIGRAEGGLMDLGGMEKDYRAEGGFVPIGAKEKADDVPARLSVNEFVFTADAVRNAGGGDIDKGAEVMENVMKNLEQGGQMSEESQGMQGAQQMFETSERLSEVI